MNLSVGFIAFALFLFEVGGVMGFARDSRFGVIVSQHTDLVATQVKFTLEEQPVVQAASSLIPELFECPVYRRTQLLFNEQVSILEEKNGWYRVRALEQMVNDDKGSRGCHGLIKSEHVTMLHAHVYENSFQESPIIASFSCGTKLNGFVYDAAWWKVQLPDNRYGFIAARDVIEQEVFKCKSADELRNLVVQQALQFNSVPYVWGGRNAHGVDCSGLIQLAYLSCGIRIQRYAHGQWKASQPVELNQLKKGDLIFFGAIRDNQLVMIHVMLYLGDDMLLEAHGLIGKVRLISARERLGKSLSELRNGDFISMRRFVYGGSVMQKGKNEVIE